MNCPSGSADGVDSLTVGTADRPLKRLFRNSKVLCFNYTEFVETMYGAPNENVCYIHGSRKRKKAIHRKS